MSMSGQEGAGNVASVDKTWDLSVGNRTLVVIGMLVFGMIGGSIVEILFAHALDPFLVGSVYFSIIVFLPVVTLAWTAINAIALFVSVRRSSSRRVAFRASVLASATIWASIGVVFWGTSVILPFLEGTSLLTSLLSPLALFFFMLGVWYAVLGVAINALALALSPDRDIYKSRYH